MAKKRHMAEQIISKLPEAEVLCAFVDVGQGACSVIHLNGPESLSRRPQGQDWRDEAGNSVNPARSEPYP